MPPTETVQRGLSMHTVSSNFVFSSFDCISLHSGSSVVAFQAAVFKLNPNADTLC